MRYIKVLLLAIFLFLALVFFYQNQEPLSQQMELSLNLFFCPPMKSIPLPFYFLIIVAFFAGCLMSLSMLVWDKFNLSARLMRAKWRLNNLEHEVEKLKNSQRPAQREGRPVQSGEGGRPPVRMKKD